MAIADDISVAANGDIRRTGDAHGGASPGYYTVLDLHRFVQDLADNATESGDDFISIVRTEPSDRSTDNIIRLLPPYNIDDDLAEYLYDGSIIQNGGDEIYDGVVNFGNTSFIQVVQNGAVLSNDYWNEASHKAGTGNLAGGISSRFLLKVRTGGADIDGRRFLGLTRNFNSNYAEFGVNGSSRGNNVLALSEATDLNNATAAGTVATWTDVVNTEGYTTIDLSNGNGPQPYYSEWDRGSRSINDFYERMKWLTRAGSSETLYGLDAQLFRGITHEIPFDGATGTFTQPEALSWTDGTGQLLAISDVDGPTGIMYIQLLTGTAPANDVVVTGGSSSATGTVNGSFTVRPVSTSSFVGQSTGSSIIGAFGLGIEAADLTVTDTITDLTGTAQNPPNNQSFTVSGLVSGEDRVLVTANDGSDEVEYDQLSAAAAQNVGSGSFVVQEAIPGDTPSSGTIFIFNDSSFDEVAYTSWSGSTFTLTGTLPNSYTTGANTFIAYINTLAASSSASFSAVYQSDRSLLVKVRDGGGTPIKPFKSPATFGSGGGSAAAIRTSDA